MASQPLPPEPLCLHILVMSGSGLFKKDLFGLCDPYVKVTLRRKNKSVSVEQTKKKKKTLNPEWNEKFVFNQINLSNDSLMFEVFDENRLTRDNFLGKLHFKLHHIPIEMKKMDIYEYERSATYPLKPRTHKSRVSGTLKLKFIYYNSPPPRMGSATLMGELNLASLVEGSTGRSSPQAPQRNALDQSTDSSSSSVTSITHQQSSELAENDEEPLPEGWEERLDANGRTFYVDHANRRTQWTRPTRSVQEGAGQRRAQMEADRRRMMAQTLARRNPGMSGSESILDISGGVNVNGSPAPSSRNNNTPPPLPPRNGVPGDQIPRLPPPPSRAFPSTSSLSTTSASPRPVSMMAIRPTTPNSSSSSTPPRSSTLTTSAAPPPLGDDELPEGWERREGANGRAFYIDHTTRKTQWHKPTVTRSRPISTISLPTFSIATTTFNGTAVAPATSTPVSPTPTFTPVSPTPTPTHPSTSTPTQDLGPVPPGWEMRLLPDGRKFYIEHATRSTQWEDPRLQQAKKQASSTLTPHSRDYKVKFENLRRYLNANKPTDLPRIFEIPVRRQTLFEDSHRAIMSCKNKSHLKARLWVKFEGEKGLDYGGVSREWFFLLSHEMFNPYYGLFEYAASDNYTLQVNPESGFCNENHLEYFRFIGRILALAIYHQRLIDAFFVRPFYKMLSGKKIVLSDMETVDTEFYNSIKYVLENDPEPLCLTFTVNREFVGQVEELELKPGGSDIDVTEENKKEYIDLLMKWRFENRITKQMEALKKGFSDVISIKLLAPFDAQEIEYLICGIGEINVEDWRKNTVYAAGYKADDDAIIWFWKTVANYDNELRARLLQFVTGTSKVPMNGFGELQGSNGPQRFCIKKLGEPTSLPRSHTCFNRIDLPPYRSYHELKEKLRLAIENTEGFEGVD